MIYADYEYYVTEYLSGRDAVISATDYDFYAKSASQLVNNSTFGRISADDIPLEVKQCVCELAEVLFSDSGMMTGIITSEKVGNYAVTYANATEQAQLKSQKHNDIITKWLISTGLLYRGC